LEKVLIYLQYEILKALKHRNLEDVFKIFKKIYQMKIAKCWNIYFEKTKFLKK